MGRLSDLFPNAASVDAALKRANKAEADVKRLNKEVAGKAENSEFQTESANLQQQINEIVRAPESGGDVGAEVTQARVGIDGYDYPTLKTRIDGEVTSVKDDIKDVVHRTKTGFLKLNVIEDAYIDINGNVHAGTGTGNNWCTDFVKIDRGTNVLVSKETTYSIAFYNAAKEFVRMDGTPSEMNPKGRNEFVPNANEVYVRISFWSSQGYSIDIQNRIKLLYYREDADIYQNTDNLANLLPWDIFTMGGSEETGYHLSYSIETVSLHDFVKFDRPVLITSKNGYSYGVDMFNDELTKMYTSTWFSNDVIGTYIPAGFKLYIGVRNSGLGNNITLLDDMSEAINITYADEIVDGLKAHEIENSVSFFGLANGVRRVRGFERAESDVMIRPKYNGYLYTLTMCHDDVIDYYSDNWEVLYSRDTEFVIPKGTWYSISAGDDQAMPYYPTVEDIIEISPYTFELSSLANQVDGLLERFGALSKRIAALENLEVPSYYESHLDAKIATINTLRETSAKQFIFITDVHYNGYVSLGGNRKHSKPLLTKICEKTGINRVVNGGDLFNAGYGKTYAETLELIRQSIDYTQPDTACGQYPVIGNHDTGYDYPSGETVVGNIDSFDFAIASAMYALDPKIVRDKINPTNYYFDDEKQQLRYIISNGCLRTYTGETYTDTWRFIANALLTTPVGFNVVIIQHIVTNSSNGLHDFVYDESNTINAYHDRGIATYGGAKVNFENAQGNVICMIGGHTHQDLLFLPQDYDIAVPVIVTTSDNMGAEVGGLTRQAGTITEQAFDVFTFDTTNRKVYATRVGAGSDRVIDY